MRIGIDCRDIINRRGEMTGIGQYIFYLVKNILHADKKGEYVLFFSGSIPPLDFDFLAGEGKVKIIEIPKFIFPFFYSHMYVPYFIKKNCDLCVFPANIIPLGYWGKAIVIVHDLAIYKHPEWFLGKQFLAKNILVPTSVQKAQKIICVSENTKKDLIELFKIKPEKITVVYPGPCLKKSDEESFKEFNLEQEYFLYLGSIEPRKNILFLLDAFEEFYKQSNKFQLVLAGGKGWKNDDILSKIKELSDKNIIKYLGYVSEAQKFGLLKKSKAFVFPSLYEGFGLPVLEAISLNVPAICSNNSSLPEVLGDAGILIYPHNKKEMVNALNKITQKDFYQQLKKNCEKQKQKFSWENSAKQIIDLLK